jgi:hypothetical protein
VANNAAAKLQLVRAPLHKESSIQFTSAQQHVINHRKSPLL